MEQVVLYIIVQLQRLCLTYSKTRDLPVGNLHYSYFHKHLISLFEDLSIPKPKMPSFFGQTDTESTIKENFKACYAKEKITSFIG